VLLYFDDEAAFAARLAAAAGIALSAAPLIGAFVATRTPRPLLLGPDAESEQWVRAAACEGLEYAVCRKHRLGDHEVRIELPDTALAGRDVVLLDDVVSTGGTLVECAKQLYAACAARVDAAVTHARLDKAALARLASAGIGELASSDTVPHPTNHIAVAGLIASALK